MQDHSDSHQHDSIDPRNLALVANRWLLRVRGRVMVEIEDTAGRRLGPYRKNREVLEKEVEDVSQHNVSPNLFELTIPGATYNPGRSFTTAFLGRTDRYSFRLQGQAPSVVDVYLTAFSSNNRLDTAFFHAIPMTEDSRASFVYNTDHPLESIAIKLLPKPGSEVLHISPTAILRPSESIDHTPPTTTIAINSDNSVTLSATDHPGGSGVLRTHYTTDLRTFSIYEGVPFLIPADAKIVMAFSVDRNGNQEYPGAVRPVLGVHPNVVVFQATVGNAQRVAQQIQAFNLDPVPLTGPLEWEASTEEETPWLFIEPQAGKTPGLLTLSVHTNQLQANTYTARVLVKARTPETIFAERAISVALELSNPDLLSYPERS